MPLQWPSISKQLLGNFGNPRKLKLCIIIWYYICKGYHLFWYLSLLMTVSSVFIHEYDIMFSDWMMEQFSRALLCVRTLTFKAHKPYFTKQAKKPIVWTIYNYNSMNTIWIALFPKVKVTKSSRNYPGWPVVIVNTGNDRKRKNANCDPVCHECILDKESCCNFFSKIFLLSNTNVPPCSLYKNSKLMNHKSIM